MDERKIVQYLYPCRHDKELKSCYQAGAGSEFEKKKKIGKKNNIQRKNH